MLFFKIVVCVVCAPSKPALFEPDAQEMFCHHDCHASGGTCSIVTIIGSQNIQDKGLRLAGQILFLCQVIEDDQKQVAPLGDLVWLANKRAYAAEHCKKRCVARGLIGDITVVDGEEVVIDFLGYGLLELVFVFSHIAIDEVGEAVR